MTTDVEHRQRWLGSTLVLASAVLFSCSGVLTKAIEAGSWTILTWRGLIGALGIGGYVWWRDRSRPVAEVFRLGGRGWLVATVGAVGSVTFIVSFKNTFVANVSVIYATIPFVAAALERLFLGRSMRHRTLRAAMWSLVGVVIIVGGSLGSPTIAGDAVALLMVVLNALYMVLIRAFPDTDAVLAGAAGGPLLFAAGWFVGTPLDVTAADGLLLVAFGVVFAVATVLWIEGTRRISAAESGLLGSAETPVAIGLAWLVLGEAPPVASAIGALIVLAAVLGHARPSAGDDRSAG
ncbi:MAG: DMT family transporter [Actinomycetota bacterium]